MSVDIVNKSFLTLLSRLKDTGRGRGRISGVVLMHGMRLTRSLGGRRRLTISCVRSSCGIPAFQNIVMIIRPPNKLSMKQT